MLKNYAFKDVEILLIKGKTIQATVQSINEFGMHATDKDIHEFIPRTAVERMIR
jgi:hypothetical protein